MAHPSRRASVERLRRQVPGLAVAFDPEPTGPPTSVRSAALAWAGAAPGATHHLVLEDDAVPCDHLLEHCETLCRAFPGTAISLFVNNSARTAAVARMAVWSGHDAAPVVDPYVPTQGLLLPAAVAHGLATFLRDHDDLDEPGDVATLRYLRAADVPVVVVVPNAVDHADMTSIMGNEDHGRRESVCFTGQAGGAGTVFDPPAVVPYLSESTGRSHVVGFSSAVPLRVPTVDVLHLLGQDLVELQSMLPSNLAQECASFGIGPDHLLEVWLTAWASGSVLTGAGRASLDTVEETTTTRAGRAAARSLGRGGLERVVPDTALAAACDSLGEVVRHGLLVGARAGGQSPWPDLTSVLVRTGKG